MGYFICIAIVFSIFISVDAFAADDFDRIYIAKKAVKMHLKDPDSAKFENVFVNIANVKGSKIPMVCGYVNSKNMLGGYTGYKRFVSSGFAELTVIEGQMDDFLSLWNSVCE